MTPGRVTIMSDDHKPFATGSCQCGHVTYEVSSPPMATYVCYCTECQKLSAGVASTTMAIPRGALNIDPESLKQFERKGHGGTRNVAHFCPECGNRIYHDNPDQPEILRLKTGTLDNQEIVQPVMHVWTIRKPHWLPLPEGGLVYETQDTPAEMLAALQAHLADQQA
jgi:hypothetical protein